MDEEQKQEAEELLFSGKQKPSFAKTLFFGILDHAKVFPFPKIDKKEEKETDLLIKKINTFCDEHLDPAWIDKHSEIPDKVIHGLAQLGTFSLNVPKKYGGKEASQYTNTRVIETLARRCSSTALFANVQQSIGMQAFLLKGTEKQREQWLPELISVNKIAAFSLTEANAGSDASGLETRAVYNPEKKTYTINGRKQWTTNGGIADVITLMAKTEVDTPKGKKDKITAFLITPPMKGFIVLNKALDKVGMRGTKTANLLLENVEVPEENILGEVGEGLKLALSILNYGRITFGAACTGAAKEIYERALSHVQSRHQFKRPIGSFTLVKQKIASMSGKVYAMDAMTKLTAGLMDSGQNDVMLEASMLKVFTSDRLWEILYDTMQIYGGRSLFPDEPFERLMRDSRLNMIGEGSNEVLRAFIGGVGIRDVGMQLKEIVDSLKSPLSEAKPLFINTKSLLRYLKTPKIPIKNIQLTSLSKKLTKAIQRFGRSIPRLLAKHKEAIIEEQITLDRIATCAMSIYAMIASLSKLDTDLTNNEKPKNTLSSDINIVTFFFKEQLQIIEQSFNTMFCNNDAMINSLSDQLTGIKYNL